MNILLIGLDSRKDQDGNDLPDEVLDKLHAGDSDAGGYNTNTLILVHISADDRVVAFSIPRDDYVAVSGITGYDHIKIKEAYGLTKFADRTEAHRGGCHRCGRARDRRPGSGPQSHLARGAQPDRPAHRLLRRGEPGRLLRSGTKPRRCRGLPEPRRSRRLLRSRLPGRPAAARCRAGPGLRPAASRTGERRPRPHPPAAGFPVVGDARTAAVRHRSPTWTSSTSLMDVARKDIVLSEGWGEDQFRRMAALAGGNVEFRTLPVVRYETSTAPTSTSSTPRRSAPRSPAPSTGTHQPPSPRPPAGRNFCPVPGRWSTWSTPAAPPDSPPRPPTFSASTATPPTRSATECPVSRWRRSSTTAPEPRPTPGRWPTCWESRAHHRPIAALTDNHIRVVLGENFELPPEEPDPVARRFRHDLHQGLVGGVDHATTRPGQAD